MGWLADADVVVVSKARLRWIIDKLTDARHSEAERISIVAHHPFWKAYEQTDADRQREADAVAEA